MRPGCLAVICPHQGLPDVHDGALDIKVLPPEPGHLATPEPGHKEEQEGRIQAMLLECWQELAAHVLHTQGPPLLAHSPWGLCQPGHIACHQGMLFRQAECMGEGNMLEPNG